MRDSALNRQTYYEHDLANRPMRTYVYNPNGMTYWTKLGYDQCNNMHTFTEKLGDRAYTTTYTYDTENRPTLVQYNNAQVAYTYDKLGRMTSRAVQVGNNNYTTSYSYAAGGHGANSTTDLISGITQSGFNFDYEYDAVGNIISEIRGNQTTTYVYDNLNQLTRVNDPYQNKTFVYSYDLGGNIRQVRTYAYTTGALGTVQETCTYTYGDTNWKDKMTTFGGKAITYDQIGNPTEYDGWSFTWQAGRQLKEMTKDSRYARFSYDHDGMRTRKQTESGRTDYYWSGKRLLELKVGDDVLHMYYDAASKPAAVSYGNNRYRYVYNLQGDVVALVDAGQAAVVEYRYDAWGKLLATTGSMANTLGKLNPFRYRGYIYDEETGLYWLRSRYYNPEWKRFVNADSVLGKKGGLLSHNLFTYCYNNPTKYSDPNGKASIAMYFHAMGNSVPYKQYDFTGSTIGNSLNIHLCESVLFRDILSRHLSTVNDLSIPTTFSYSIPIEDYPSVVGMIFTGDLDLYLAARKCDLTVTVTPSNDSFSNKLSAFGFSVFNISYTLSDAFDFDKLSPENQRPTLIQWFNDTFGYYPQENGHLTPYSWKAEGEMYLIVGHGLFDLSF